MEQSKPVRFRFYIYDINQNSMTIEPYEVENRISSTEKLVEQWLASEHDGTWGDVKYGTFNSPDNKSPEASFIEPFSTKENQPDPPEGKSDFEHLMETEYVSRIPIPVAERIGKKLESELTDKQKESLVDVIEGCNSIEDIHPHVYTELPYTRGLPDILAWEEDALNDGSYKFIEVKKVDREGGYQDGMRVDQALWFSSFDIFDSYILYAEEMPSEE